MTVDLWDWIYERRQEYQRAGDEERVRLTKYWECAHPFGETDPDRAVALLAEGRLLAAELGDRWWKIILDQWHLAALLHFKRDYRQAVELAVRNAVAVSRPENAAYPGRWHVYRDLAGAYIGVDPEGYAERIRETLAYIDREIPAETVEARYLTLGCLRQFHQEMGDFAAVEATVTQAQNLLDRDYERRESGEYSMIFHYSALCWVAARREDWRKLAEVAALGEEMARTYEKQMELCEFLAWQAVLARRDGEEARAQRLHTTAAAKRARLRMPSEREYPDATALFHELGGDLDKALQMREWELANIAGTGRLAYECEIHVKRAALLAKMGLLRTAHLDAARQAALILHKPEKALAEIDKLAVSLR